MKIYNVNLVYKIIRHTECYQDNLRKIFLLLLKIENGLKVVEIED